MWLEGFNTGLLKKNCKTVYQRHLNFTFCGIWYSKPMIFPNINDNHNITHKCINLYEIIKLMFITLSWIRVVKWLQQVFSNVSYPLSFKDTCWVWTAFTFVGKVFPYYQSQSVSINWGSCLCYSVVTRLKMGISLCSMAPRRRWRSWGRWWKRGGPKPKLRWVLILTELQLI